METPHEDGSIVPVLILDTTGKLVATALQNDKARNKSLEQKTLWVVDGSTGRVLPWAAGGTYLGSAATAGIPYAGPGETAVLENFATGADGWPLRQDARDSGLDNTGPKAGMVPPSGIAQINQIDANFVYELEALIRQRKIDMPEGSYTSHLFKAGVGKIRKKTGEEAVELILADSKETIASEASDLLYHMTVLFAETGVTWQEVLATLKKR